MNHSSNMSPMSKRGHQAGFTLLEVLIAIGITALIGLGTWQLLSGTIRAQEITQKNSERFEKLQKMMLILSRDIQQISHRSIRDEYGDFQPAVSNRNALYFIELTRAGWRNPTGDARSDLQRVSYELLDGELLRHYWTVLDRPQDSESVIQTVLTDIDTLSVRFMNDDNQWSESWPPEQTNTNNVLVGHHLLPKAIELTIEHHYFGTLVRLYDLPQFMDVKSAANGGNSGSGGSNAEEDDSQQEGSTQESSQQDDAGLNNG
ncbi:type II secretion system minor pseudopilin GspJ [Alkalimarinus alittae]|uniref:Type II secretion system protein J n=1 Tax=Alkalimarinus alittae TaxID=2961619 RepID=A0ABY6MXG2_9ALTE|nr:type II secretion system minor pseudopilin GspJ [Alkalimarinus alittae]UZE94477.1 type II secretion system minor pseudopilin GspJ [Alkalimarinus alittae]